MQSENTSAKRTRWGEKPYYSLDYHYRELFGQKVYKIALDASMTCPNRDGTIHDRGCIFCSNGGSGEFAMPPQDTISTQIDKAIDFLQQHGKKTGNQFIAYFQSFSNTYGPVEYLEKIFTQAMAHPSIAGLSIATRPDCFSPEVYKLLEELQKQKPLWVELGLQTIHESTARFIGNDKSFKPAGNRWCKNPVIAHFKGDRPSRDHSSLPRPLPGGIYEPPPPVHRPSLPGDRDSSAYRGRAQESFDRSPLEPGQAACAKPHFPRHEKARNISRKIL